MSLLGLKRLFCRKEKKKANLKTTRVPLIVSSEEGGPRVAPRRHGGVGLCG